MGKRFAAYLYLFIAGNASAWLACALINRHNFSLLFTHFHWDDLPLTVLPGAAAAIAGLVVQWPFLRAARAGRGAAMYGWTLLGVMAAHAAYTALVFAHAVFSAHAYGLDALSSACVFGIVSVVLGFLPNLLLGMGFTKAVLWLHGAPQDQPAGAAMAGGSL